MLICLRSLMVLMVFIKKGGNLKNHNILNEMKDETKNRLPPLYRYLLYVVVLFFLFVYCVKI